MRDPWMYQECGHVFGQHQWKGGPGVKEGGGATRTCPMCRKVGVTFTCTGSHDNKACCIGHLTKDCSKSTI